MPPLALVLLLFTCLLLAAPSRQNGGGGGCWPTSDRYLSLTNTQSGTCMRYAGFNDFGLLNINCDIEIMLAKEDIDCMEFYPSEEIFIKKSIDLNNLFLYYRNGSFDITLTNLKGVLLQPSARPMFLLEQSNGSIVLYIYVLQTSLDLYYHPGKMIDAATCFEMAVDHNSSSPFTNMDRNVVLQFMHFELRQQKICPILFRNARISRLYFYSLKDTFFAQNYNGFYQTPVYQDMNTQIYSFTIADSYRIQINLSNFDESIFRRVNDLTIDGTILGIQAEFFRLYSNLNSFALSLFNGREFWHSSDNRWLASLNLRITVNEKDLQNGVARHSQDKSLSFYVHDQSRTYEYPEEDFCLFRHFPHQHLVVPVLYRAGNVGKLLNSSKPTCTILFILKNYPFYKELFLQTIPDAYYYFDLQREFFDACDIERRLVECSNFTATPISIFRSDFNYYDAYYLMEWLEFVGPLVSFPIVAFFAFIFNLITILVIKNKHNSKDFEDRIFRFIVLNSGFNCIECMLTMLHLLSECIERDSIYCPQIRLSIWVQYLQVYLVGYMGEIMKTASIMTSLAFSFERLIDTSTSNRSFYRFFKNASMTRITFVIVGLSALSSISKVFEYEVKPDVVMINFYTDFPVSFANTVFRNKSAITVASFFYFFHYVLNDFFLLLLNLLVDLILAMHIKRDLKVKRRFLFKTKRGKLNSHVVIEAHHKTSELKIQEVEKKLDQMLVLSLLVYFLCRIPELGANISFYFFKINVKGSTSTCRESHICTLISYSIEYGYLISYLTNIYFYVKFNRSFRKGFKRFFCR